MGNVRSLDIGIFKGLFTVSGGLTFHCIGLAAMCRVWVSSLSRGMLKIVELSLFEIKMVTLSLAYSGYISFSKIVVIYEMVT